MEKRLYTGLTAPEKQEAVNGGNMEIDVKVMVTKGNPERQANAHIMLKELEQIEGASVSSVESGLSDVWSAFIGCFQLCSPSGGLLLLEDDVKLCRDFHTKVMEQISAHPDDVVSFFEKPNSRKELKSGMQPGREFGFGTCNWFPREICTALADPWNELAFRDYWPSRKEKWTYPNDIYVRWVLQKLGKKYYMQIPFLVQHLPFKSALGNRSTHRQTRYFIDDMEGTE